EQERVIELLAGAAEFARPLLERVDQVDRNRPGLGEQTSDQGRFAVVDRAAGDEAQEIARVARARDLDPPRPAHPLHQKYPPRFLRSIDAGVSISISRPARSDQRLLRNSAITASSVAASDSIAALSG